MSGIGSVADQDELGNAMHWSWSKKIALRFLFIYVVLYCLPLPPQWLWSGLVLWAGKLLGVDATFRMNGTGDSAFHYVQVLCLFLAALAGSIIWFAADRKGAYDHRLYLALRVLIRLYVGTMLIRYGVAKVIQVQFPVPALHRLVQPLGDASPMGLLWNFMGISPLYNIFTGSIEVLGGVLLFFPRTSLLGALISIAVMAQICALNFCYDVPVKLFSLHLLGMATFLAAEDAGRLASMFLLNRSVPPASTETLLRKPLWARGAFVLKLVLLAIVTGTGFYSASQLRNTIREQAGAVVDPSGFPLLNRGFHWINESPYNR
jgi:hypothetical protein